jgi:hypothetical protein
MTRVTLEELAAMTLTNDWTDVRRVVFEAVWRPVYGAVRVVVLDAVWDVVLDAVYGAVWRAVGEIL